MVAFMYFMLAIGRVQKWAVSNESFHQPAELQSEQAKSATTDAMSWTV